MAQVAGEVDVAYVGLVSKQHVALTLLEPPPTEEGVQGARLAMRDNQTTGQFLNQTFSLQEAVAADEAGVLDAAKAMLASGRRMVIADLPTPTLLKLADLPEAKDATILDATSSDDALRGEQCRRNVLHTLPSYAMRADALMQYLAVKQWRNILLAVGPSVGDQAYADAIRRSAKKFRLKLAADKPWTYQPGAKRTDTGHFALAAEAQRFTQGISYDVLVVVDLDGDFGDDLTYRTTDPRPVMGTQGMVPTAWQFPFEQWGATQLQLRFQKQAKRWMTEKDFGAWMAGRAIGEAATRATALDATTLGAYMRSKEYAFAAFKGSPVSFRSWDGQLRQPVLLMDPRSLVSVSPQPGFLHEVSELDTLGIDQPETKCKLQ
jgi:ABC transporter substrate binding protein (PQQ-dependent alcohol dehydrogenase system)